MSGSWYLPPTPPSVSVKDINGRVLAVTDIVNLEAQVLSIQNTDTQHGYITVQFVNPQNGVTTVYSISSLASVYVSGP